MNEVHGKRMGVSWECCGKFAGPVRLKRRFGKMPNKRRKGVAGRCSLPMGYQHPWAMVRDGNPWAGPSWMTGPPPPGQGPWGEEEDDDEEQPDESSSSRLVSYRLQCHTLRPCRDFTTAPGPHPRNMVEPL